jgi:hypothetical protein
MKSGLFLFLVSAILTLSTMSWARCPEDTVDLGECDTLHVEAYPPDLLFTGPGHLVRVLILVTHDLAIIQDSIGSFAIPLCYSRSNPSKYCSLSQYWNTTPASWLAPDFSTRSIFRHVVEGSDTLYHNRMADLAADFSGRDWDFVALHLQSGDHGHFRLALCPTGFEDQRWWEGNRTLLATATFKLEDTMTICMDSCFWPPSTRLQFFRHDAREYYPRHRLPHCFSVSSFGARGDVNADGVISLGDAVYLLNYLFKGGNPPDPLETGDCNYDSIVDLGDVVYLLNYLFKGGPPPA